MKVILDRVILFAHDGQQRSIRFNPDSMNVITGESKTGKSAIIHIVDYCLGSGECHIPEGVIRRKVAWYAVVLRRGNERLLLARQNPEPGRSTSSNIHIRSVKESETPTPETFAKNGDIDGTKELLTRFVGIEENLHVPPADRTRSPLSANFSHARIFCFQDQSLIDNKNQLFFGQADSFLAQAIRDTLPYFLGAVTQQELLKQSELDRLRRDVKLLEKQLAIEVSSDEASLDKALTLLAEARQVSLVRADQRPTVTHAVFALLREAGERELPSVEATVAENAELVELQAERQSLREHYELLNSQLEEVRAFGTNKDFYEEELQEQQARLRVANIFPTPKVDVTHCPLCESEIDSPRGLISQLKNELEEVHDRLATLRAQNPRLQSYLKELSAQIEDIANKLRENQQQQNALIRDMEAFKSTQENAVRRSNVQGRISAFLESRTEDELEEMKTRLAVTQARIAQLESELKGESYDDALNHADFLLSEYMTEYARSLDLEHSDGRTRLDRRRLTVVADTRAFGSIRLENMGSGDNWVGCHVLTHLALHRFFRERDRPVPAFLILDQPSKAHYPPDQTAGDEEVSDDDRIAVKRLFKFIYDRSLKGGFQTIVIDHADEPESWFQQSVIERWRGGEKLVPDAWPIRQ